PLRSAPYSACSPAPAQVRLGPGQCCPIALGRSRPSCPCPTPLPATPSSAPPPRVPILPQVPSAPPAACAVTLWRLAPPCPQRMVLCRGVAAVAAATRPRVPRRRLPCARCFALPQFLYPDEGRVVLIVLSKAEMQEARMRLQQKCFRFCNIFVMKYSLRF
ncbi:hypothetical protein BRADI_2g25666v3, partial [Brachypodium distachyon]